MASTCSQYEHRLKSVPGARVLFGSVVARVLDWIRDNGYHSNRWFTIAACIHGLACECVCVCNSTAAHGMLEHSYSL